MRTVRGAVGGQQVASLALCFRLLSYSRVHAPGERELLLDMQAAVSIVPGELRLCFVKATGKAQRGSSSAVTDSYELYEAIVMLPNW